jgi:hypothetical protein
MIFCSKSFDESCGITKFYFRDELENGLNENSQVGMKSVQIEGQKKPLTLGQWLLS